MDDTQLPTDESLLPDKAGSSGDLARPAEWAPPPAVTVLAALSAGDRLLTALPEHDLTVGALATVEVVGETWAGAFAAAADVAQRLPGMDLQAVTASCTALSPTEDECQLTLMYRMHDRDDDRDDSPDDDSDGAHDEPPARGLRQYDHQP